MSNFRFNPFSWRPIVILLSLGISILTWVLIGVAACHFIRKYW